MIENGWINIHNQTRFLSFKGKKRNNNNIKQRQQKEKTPIELEKK